MRLKGGDLWEAWREKTWYISSGGQERKEKPVKGEKNKKKIFVGTLTVSTAPELLASEQKNQESRTRDKSEEEEEEEEGKEGQVPASRFFLPLDFTNVTLALRIVEGVPLVVKEEKYEIFHRCCWKEWSNKGSSEARFKTLLAGADLGRSWPWQELTLAGAVVNGEMIRSNDQVK